MQVALDLGVAQLAKMYGKGHAGNLAVIALAVVEAQAGEECDAAAAGGLQLCFGVGEGVGFTDDLPSSVATWSEPMIRCAGWLSWSARALASASRQTSFSGCSPGSGASLVSGGEALKGSCRRSSSSRR